MTTKNPGLLSTFTQPIYRSDVPTSKYFTQAPNVILSLMGLKQLPPTNTDTFLGFDVLIKTTRTNNFDVVHNIFGSSMTYLIYMYMAVSASNTDFFLGAYSQVFDMTVANKSYSFDVANKAGESYANYGTNNIEMKGFLAGYRLKQVTASGIYLNFTLKVKNASSFTISVNVDNNSVL